LESKVGLADVGRGGRVFLTGGRGGGSKEICSNLDKARILFSMFEISDEISRTWWNVFEVISDQRRRINEINRIFPVLV
jgi:hypothetical protein